MAGRAYCSGEVVPPTPPPALLVQEGTFLFASSPEVKRHPSVRGALWLLASCPPAPL